jgi:hypothetical protein
MEPENVAIDILQPRNLIFTFVFFLHGGVYNLELSEEDLQIFDNCRLFSKTADFTITCNDPNIIESVIKKMQQPIYGPTYDTFVKRGLEKDSILRPLPRITYDKLLGVHHQYEIFNHKYGIFLVSIHEKIDGINVYKDMFPKVLNFLIVDDFIIFARAFGMNISKFSTEMFIVPSSDLSFKLWSGIELSPDGKLIMKIKLSKLIEIIKLIVGPDNYFNLLDLSCSLNNTDVKIRDYNKTAADIENMAGEEIWGGKKIKRRNKKCKTKNKRFIRKKRKSRKK